MQEDEQQPYLSDQEHPAYSEKDYEEYIDFPQSMLEPSIHLIRQFKTWHSKLKE